jgi:hypothetical protein
MWYHKDFKLKQHTLLLHFEHDKEATLRASEVKPKLDRYLIKEKKGWSNIPNEWKIKDRDNEKDKRMQALSYKMAIIPGHNPIVGVVDKKFPSFFGNSKSEKYYYSFVVNSNKDEADKMTIRLLSQEAELLDYIEEKITAFFNVTAFGARQSKGFGVFSIDKKIVNCQEKNYYGQYYFDVPIENINVKSEADTIEIIKNNQEKIFRHIDLFWRVLRSGINLKEDYIKVSEKSGIPLIEQEDSIYCKPVLFYYLASKGIQWDKKTLKSAFILKENIKLNIENRSPLFKEYICKACAVNNGVNNIYVSGLERQIERRKNEDNNIQPLQFESAKPHYLWRDLLGLSTYEKWMYYDFEITKKDASNSDKSTAITRFQSPIHFHPIVSDIEGKSTCTVWLNCVTIPQKYQETEFTIKNTKSNKEIPLPIASRINDKEITDLSFLINWLIKNKSDYLKNNWREKNNPPDSDKYKSIKQVLDTLKKATHESHQ